MRLGLYTFASLALIGLVAVFVYTLNPGNYTIEFAGVNLNLPVALWFAAPMLLLLLVTLFHMMYHGAKGYFTRRRWIRDANEMQDALYWALLKQPKEHTFAIPEMKSGASVLSVSSLALSDTPEGLSDKLSAAATWVEKIERGEYVDLKEKKVAKFLSFDNPLVIRNEINRLQREPAYAEEILQTKESHDPAVAKAALDILAQHATFAKAHKFAVLFDAEHFETMLERADSDREMGLNAEVAEHFSTSVEMKCPNYMRLAKSTIQQLTPDENLALFKKFATENEAAENAYLYLLFQYEMLDAVGSFLEESEEDEFVPFRALYTLIREKHNYRLHDIISSATVCNDA